MDRHDGKAFPSGVLYAAGALILFSLVVAFVGRATGLGTQAPPDADAVQTVDVRFVDEGPEGLEMRSAESGELLATLHSGEDGFVRGVLRGMNRTRRLEGIPAERPFQLVKWSDGRISIKDLNTAYTVQIVGFGATNSETFHRLMASAEGI